MDTMTPEDMETLAHLYATKDVLPRSPDYINTIISLGKKYSILTRDGARVWADAMKTITSKDTS
jgi:hypothetical protein